MNKAVVFSVQIYWNKWFVHGAECQFLPNWSYQNKPDVNSFQLPRK